MTKNIDAPVVAFLPCRSGSVRCVNKNTRAFGAEPLGLFSRKIGHLLECDALDAIFVSTDDEVILDYCESRISDSRLVLHSRDEKLASSLTTTDQLISHACSLVSPSLGECHVMWTHVTSPFIDSDVYHRAIQRYVDLDPSVHDSLMSVNEIRSFLWSGDVPINYDRIPLRWPFTQDLRPLYEVNSGIFLAPIKTYMEKKDRVGDRPFMFVTDELMGFDIDSEIDFKIAELIDEVRASA